MSKRGAKESGSAKDAVKDGQRESFKKPSNSKTGTSKKISSKTTGRTERQPVTWQTVQQIACELPGAEEGTSYGTPAFKVRGKLFVRFHQSGESVVVHVEIQEREELLRLNPETFYITDHYRCWPWVLVRLSAIKRDDLRKILEESWRRVAPKQMVAMFEQ